MTGHFSEPPEDRHNWSTQCKRCEGPVDEYDGGVLCPDCADDNGLCQQCGGPLNQDLKCYGECFAEKADIAMDRWRDMGGAR